MKRITFENPRTIKIVDRQRTSGTPEANTERSRSPVPGSSQVSGIEIRMLPPLIKNNRTLKIWPFPGKAKLYCVTLVISDAANQLQGQMDLSSFAKVGDNEHLPINKTIFYWEKPDKETPAPNQVHVVSSIIKSKSTLREAGKVMSSIRGDNEYQQLLGQLSGLSANTASFKIITDISLQLSTLIGRYLGRVDDTPIGGAVHSFTRLHGDWDELGVKRFQVMSDNVDFHFELVVRDEERYMLQHSQDFLTLNEKMASHESRGMMPL
jgi:hypothetical protein